MWVFAQSAITLLIRWVPAGSICSVMLAWLKPRAFAGACMGETLSHSLLAALCLIPRSPQLQRLCECMRGFCISGEETGFPGLWKATKQQPALCRVAEHGKAR